MWDRRHIPDSGNIKAGTLKRTDSCLTPATRTLNIYFHLPQAMHHGFAGGITSRHLSRIRSALSRTLKPGRSRTSPGYGIPLRVSEGYYGIVEGRLDVSPPGRNRFTFPPPCFGSLLLWHPTLLVNGLNYFLAMPRLWPLPATVLRGPRLVRALVRVRCPLTGKP